MKLLMTSLGCDKNLVDSERMLSILLEHGFVLTDDEQEAEVAVINTCCFIDDAKKESIDKIFELAALKETGSLRVLVAAGCMAQRYKDEILEDIPELDAIVGTTGIDGIADAVDQALRGQKAVYVSEMSKDPSIAPGKRVVTTGGHFAYLKIAEGCDKNCTYCAIPKFRGHYRSFPEEDLLQEAQQLADRGVKELILVAQETTLYGVDLYGRKCLHELLKKLCLIDGIHWIRLLYCYPEEIYPELIEVMAEEPKVCHYLDLPIQSGCNTVLKRMARRTTTADLKELIGTLREKMPDIVLRTTFISGFPGETDEEAAETAAFVKEMKFNRLGVFQYSKEEGTPAARMKPQITKAVKKKRFDEIMRLQQTISLEHHREMVGKTVEVFVEGSIPEDDVYVGRTPGDAPSVDGFLFFSSKRDLQSGDFVKVRITAASEYDLQGEEEEE
ncbi:MAG: 30S ribosomal protein S12 methylthiotransferase RimO [Lachnospiraceae bacterium]|nr:30S ribosomal protein S12 methylthiotransferase RimO [Lachnospiraceae bacterium]